MLGVGGDELFADGEEDVERGAAVGGVDHEGDVEAGGADAGNGGGVVGEVSVEDGGVVVGPVVEADLVGDVDDEIAGVFLQDGDDVGAGPPGDEDVG